MRHSFVGTGRLLACALCIMVFLAGCSRGLMIDTRHSASAQDSRVQYVVVHYTSSNSARSLRTLTTGEVSSHYLIDVDPPVIYRLVDENRRAWHAGDSSWQGRTWLNASSIGIEIVHPGYRDTPEGRLWHPWNERQIDQLVLLLKDVLKRHQLPPDRVIGHSDIAPQRKVDPGPLFPWQRLAQAGVAIWPDAATVADYLRLLNDQTPPPAWFDMALASFGYNLTGTADQTTVRRNVLAAFQMRFRPARYDGQPDAQTAAILAALVPGSFSQIPGFIELQKTVPDEIPTP